MRCFKREVVCFSVSSDLKRHIQMLLQIAGKKLVLFEYKNCTRLHIYSQHLFYFIMSVSRCKITPESLLFFFQRETDLECFHGSWDRVVSCQPVDCGLPDQSHVYHAIFSCPWGTTFGKQCSFTCGSPAILQGKSWIHLFQSILVYQCYPSLVYCQHILYSLYEQHNTWSHLVPLHSTTIRLAIQDLKNLT